MLTVRATTPHAVARALSARPIHSAPTVSKRRPKPNQHRRSYLKRKLAERDGLCCFYCRTEFASPREATIDHLIPQSVLPGWCQFNLVLACFACNHAKSNTLPQVFLRHVAERQEAARRAAGWRARLGRWLRDHLPAVTPVARTA